MTHRVTSYETRNSRRNWLLKIGGVSSQISAILLIIGLISLFSPFLRNETSYWSLIIPINWLIKIFILHAGFSEIHSDLIGLNLMDIFMLLLFSIICLGISTIFSNARRVLLLITFALLMIGIMLFLATQNAGRSTLMLSLLIISSVIINDKTFTKATAFAGILASVLLFVGDLTVGVQSNIITILFSIGYVLLIAWYFLIAKGLYRLCNCAFKENPPGIET